MNAIYTIYGHDAKALAYDLMKASDVAAMIPKNARIALKPNLVVGKPAGSGATTHPEAVEGVIEYLLENGRSDISVMEGAWVGEDTMRACKINGLLTVCEKYSLPFYDLKKDRCVTVGTKAGPMRICERALNAGFLINMPVLKGHCQTTMTCAIKNCKGCIPDGEKRRFHSAGLHRPIAALSAAIRPALTLVDAICGDLSFEEGGNPVDMGRMMLGGDMVALDAHGCRLMGIDPASVPYIGMAEEFGAGRVSPGGAKLIDVNAPSPFEYSAGGGIKRLTRNVEQRSACSACYGSLVHALYRLDSPGLNTLKLAVGQGWKDVSFDGIGVGNCVNKAGKQIKGCPVRADDVIKALTNYLKG